MAIPTRQLRYRPLGTVRCRVILAPLEIDCCRLVIGSIALDRRLDASPHAARTSPEHMLAQWLLDFRNPLQPSSPRPDTGGYVSVQVLVEPSIGPLLANPDD